ncbi:hypothetical protein ABE52_05310, partial [Bacillus thuringiensis]|nr:hypothetical protein [Bacillus thuringiensis]
QQQFAPAQDGGQRGAQFVRERGQELVLQPGSATHLLSTSHASHMAAARHQAAAVMMMMMAAAHGISPS